MKNIFKTILSICCLVICFTFVLTGCDWFREDCAHAYDNDCDATCNRCGETRQTQAHQWKDATCTYKKHCKDCDYTVGEMLPHDSSPLHRVRHGLYPGFECPRILGKLSHKRSRTLAHLCDRWMHQDKYSRTAR